MEFIFVDMPNYKLPLYCEECAKNHLGLTRISLVEAKGMLPKSQLLCADCNKNFENLEI
jgi:hypothetical protein